MDKKDLIMIIISFGITFLICYLLFTHEKKRNKRIISSISPQLVKLIDIIVYKEFIADSANIYYLPVLKSVDNRIYISTSKGNYGNIIVPYSTSIYGKKLKLKFKNLEKNDIEIGMEGNLYIEKEGNKVIVENNIVNFDNKKMPYMGNIYQYEGKIEKLQLYSLTNNNILEILNNATEYYGIIDFDTESFKNKYYKMEKLK